MGLIVFRVFYFLRLLNSIYILGILFYNRTWISYLCNFAQFLTVAFISINYSIVYRTFQKQNKIHIKKYVKLIQFPLISALFSIPSTLPFPFPCVTIVLRYRCVRRWNFFLSGNSCRAAPHLCHHTRRRWTFLCKARCHLVSLQTLRDTRISACHVAVDSLCCSVDLLRF